MPGRVIRTVVRQPGNRYLPLGANEVHLALISFISHGAARNAVRRYIQETKKYSQEVFMPLAFEPGEEAQVDRHEGWIEENGVQRKAQFFCMRLCYSKASFVWSYERANPVRDE